MIKLFPKSDLDYSCPVCKKKAEVKDYKFSGMRFFVKVYCYSCKDEFFADLPIGFALFHQYFFSEKNEAIYSQHSFPTKAKEHWLYSNLKKIIDSRKKENKIPISYEKGEKKSKKAVIINCLDVYYGHSLLKLLNTQQYISNDDLDIVCIAPRFLLWMVPEKVQHLIIVDISLRKSYLWMENLDIFLKEKILKSYEEIYISKTYTQFFPEEFDIKLFTGFSPFYYNENEPQKTRITFIWREDRIIRSDKKLVSIAQSLKKHYNLGLFYNFFLWKQKQMILKIYRRLNAQLDNFDFFLVGTDTRFSFPRSIIDERKKVLNKEVERLWCDIYAKSKLVIGVHGSNMLLPSALAGMTLELLPDSRLNNIQQDILYSNPLSVRNYLFRYRFLPLSTRLKTIILTIFSMLDNYNRIQPTRKTLDENKNV